MPRTGAVCPAPWAAARAGAFDGAGGEGGTAVPDVGAAERPGDGAAGVIPNGTGNAGF
ncbi:hypothetical protein [Microvirga rosea]|uniref:hypothetical protein n=1 Tax=Microvirga rosea TaxID=2715425 RepID=UPI001D0B7486|nr:hypothetical protein [Microvirga rosea]MCB8819644.1 hypothetical protein [Microvirga rosea]